MGAMQVEGCSHARVYKQAVSIRYQERDIKPANEMLRVRHALYFCFGGGVVGSMLHLLYPLGLPLCSPITFRNLLRSCIHVRWLVCVRALA